MGRTLVGAELSYRRWSVSAFQIGTDENFNSIYAGISDMNLLMFIIHCLIQSEYKFYDFDQVYLIECPEGKRDFIIVHNDIAGS